MPFDTVPHLRADGVSEPGSASDAELSRRVDAAVALLDAALAAHWPYPRPYIEALTVLFERLYAWQRVPLFLSRGTLLACVRNGTAFEWDTGAPHTALTGAQQQQRHLAVGFLTSYSPRQMSISA